MDLDLIQKYSKPGPRYTSYPTVPFWDEVPPTRDEWISLVRAAFKKSNDSQGISLYIHLPYCESLCTYCACNTRITINHKVEEPYIKALLKEWQLYLELVLNKPNIKEIHLGGGTPTFFKPENVKKLIVGILSKAKIAKPPFNPPKGGKEEHEFGFEAHPDNTTSEHLKVLYDLGFRQLSLGIQDFDPKVQKIINRIQSFKAIEKITSEARKIGYQSINYDLIYGLPLQTIGSMVKTMGKVISLKPDRIAFYSYAHVPWLKPGQRKYTAADLPGDVWKRRIYETGRELLEYAGYHEIGMDHFALRHDALYKAKINRALHRNFMGYTPAFTQLLIGLGVSSISDTWCGYAQNEKMVENYITKVNNGELAIFKGHRLNEEDLILRRHILNLMCRFETSWESPELQYPTLYEGLKRLKGMEADKLITINSNHLAVHKKGMPFIRNICMALDARLWRKKPKEELFSSTI